MSPALKQRLIGAAVLIALAVIFLPMLVKGPAPASGLPDMPLQVPDAPEGDYRTVDLPLITPPPAREGGVVAGGPLSEAAAGTFAATAPDGGALPTVDTAEEETPLPATVAGGGYAVHYAAFASEGDADAILRQLGQSGLTGYREAFTLNGKPAQRVRLGPYANRADAEIVRVRAAQVRDDVTPRVVALDAGARPDVPRPQTPAPAPRAATQTPAPAPAAPPARETPRTPPAETPAPAATPPAPAAQPAPAPTSGTGFVVQLGAFGNAAEANRLRDRLRGAGITAFTDAVDTDKGRLTRVKAGPVASRADAEQLKTRARAAVGVDGIIRAHP